MEKSWKKYETEITQIFKDAYPNFNITKDEKIVGRYSKTKRQIDILIQQRIAGNKILIIIDCKYFNKKVDVKDVESFISMTNDVSAHKGMLVTNKGYSDAALKRAHNGPEDIELDIINFDELKAHQTFGAIPFVDDKCVAVIAPMGWVIDVRNSEGFVASMYRRGLDLQEAIKTFEFAYINFNKKNSTLLNIDSLINNEIERITEFVDKISKHEVELFEGRLDVESKIRISDIPSYKGNELAGYVDFGEFIFCFYLLTDYETTNRNKRRLEKVLETVKSGTVIINEG